jgi:hypothetical protein
LFLEQRYASVLDIHIPGRIFRINLPLSIPASVFIPKKYACTKSTIPLVALRNKKLPTPTGCRKKKVMIMKNKITIFLIFNIFAFYYLFIDYQLYM